MDCERKRRREEVSLRNFADMSLEELLEMRARLREQLTENTRAYESRYGSADSGYGASIQDDYNGDGDDYAEFVKALNELEEHLRQRRRQGTT